MTRTRWTIPALALAAMFATGNGCNYVVPAAYILFGPGDTDAETQLAPVRTVVFVDDRQNILPRTLLRAAIGENISQELIAQGVIPAAVEPRQAITLTRQKEGSGNPMSIASVGRDLDCQQVIYVQITAFSLGGDGGYQTSATSSGVGVTPTAKATIKVIDVLNNERTYPISDTGGRELMASMREVDPDKLQTVAARRGVEDQLAAKLAKQISFLFYKHETVEMGEHLGPRTK